MVRKGEGRFAGHARGVREKIMRLHVILVRAIIPFANSELLVLVSKVLLIMAR